MAKRLFFFFLILPLVSNAGLYKSHSVLTAGNWYKVAVTEVGIHKITYEDLTGMGMDLSSVDPANLRVYGNGGGMLPEANAVKRIDDLRQIPIQVVDGGDGHFDPGDYLLFYGEAPDKWTLNYNTKLFAHQKNLFSDRTYYFVTADLGPGLRIQPLASVTATPNSYSHRISDYGFHDVDSENLIKSGKIWVGEVFNDTLASHDFYFRFPNIDTNSAVRINTHVVARSQVVSKFYVYVNDSLIDQISVDYTDFQSISLYARDKTKGSLIYHPADSLHIRLQYDVPNSSSVGWLDYLELNLQRQLIFAGPQMPFRDVNSIGDGKITEFVIEGANTSVSIWDVTQADSVRNVLDSLSGTTLRFRLPTDTLREFVAFDGSAFFPVIPVGPVANQDIHGMPPTTLIIVTHPDFAAQAQQLADFHVQHNGMSASVVTTENVYNELGGGQPDLTAIRDYVKMQYDRGGANRPKYLLLFGDGSYDYRDRVPGNSNFVPTYESTESLKFIGTYVTDDYFGILGTNEGADSYGTLEIGIGRFPVSNTSQAQAIVDKIIEYSQKTDTTLAPWKNKIAFIADDEDGNLHLIQAEELASIVQTKYPVFNVQKTYIDAYQLVTTPSGVRYPDVNPTISKTVNDGSLIVNYTGHGGEDGWAGEKILTIPDIETWNNTGKYPVFVTATCEFSRFDNPERFSAGEMVIVKPHAGALALYTTTRLALATSNFKLDTAFFRHLMDKDGDGNYLKMGDLIRISKNNNNNNTNIRNFVLLGDPSQSIAFPKYKVLTTEVNSVPAGTPDTLLGMSLVNVKGKVVDGSGNTVDSFNGTVYPKVFDKWTTYSTLGNQSKSYPQTFQVQNSVLSDGKASVNAGQFEFSFVVPCDISLQLGFGKISYYATDHQTDGNGYYDDIVIGSREPDANPVNPGPDISLFMDSRSFVDGGVTGLNPLLIADLSDPQGINSIGLGIGHEILMVLDDEWAHPVVLNPYYSQNTDSYSSGTVSYQLENLAIGRHSLTLKAWDMYNNPSENTINFFVFEHPVAQFKLVANYPNPFKDQTDFVIQATESGQVEILIYSLTGKPVKTITYALSGAYPYPNLSWDGTDDNGNKLSTGIYPYRVILKGSNGGYSETSQKLVIIR
jgi:hypothetical protein